MPLKTVGVSPAMGRARRRAGRQAGPCTQRPRSAIAGPRVGARACGLALRVGVAVAAPLASQMHAMVVAALALRVACAAPEASRLPPLRPLLRRRAAPTHFEFRLGHKGACVGVGERRGGADASRVASTLLWVGALGLRSAACWGRLSPEGVASASSGLARLEPHMRIRFSSQSAQERSEAAAACVCDS